MGKFGLYGGIALAVAGSIGLVTFQDGRTHGKVSALEQNLAGKRYVVSRGHPYNSVAGPDGKTVLGKFGIDHNSAFGDPVMCTDDPALKEMAKARGVKVKQPGECYVPELGSRSGL